MRPNTLVLPAARVPAEITTLMGPPPLLRSDVPEVYEALTAQCAVALAPRDMVEWLMLRDFVDLSCEILRLQRYGRRARTRRRHAVLARARDRLPFM